MPIAGNAMAQAPHGFLVPVAVLTILLAKLYPPAMAHTREMKAPEGIRVADSTIGIKSSGNRATVLHLVTN